MDKVVSFLVLLILGAFSTPLRAVQTPVDLTAFQWGVLNTSPLPAKLNGVRAVALARTNALTVDAQGNVRLWNNQSSPPAALMIPVGLTNVVDVALGDSFAAALKSDETVTCWGDMTNSPLDLFSNITQIAAGSTHLLALTTNGEVLAWGNNDYGQASVPPGLSNVIAIAANSFNSLAVQADGRAVGWGGPGSGRFDVLQTEPNIVSIATGPLHMTLLRRNGTVASYLFPRFGPVIPIVTNVPAGLQNVIAIAAGDNFSLALDSSGTVSSWGIITPLPASVHDAMTIFAAGGIAFAWVKYPVIDEFPTNVLAAPGDSIVLTVPVHGEPPLHYQWLSNGVPIQMATQSTLVLTNIDSADQGLYSVIISNASGATTSPGILLRIGPPTIVSHPEGTLATINSTVTLTVDAVGLEPLNYFWLRNGTPVPRAVDRSLMLSNVQYTNMGDYQAVVANPYGAVTSSIAHVEVSICDQQQTSSGGWAHLQRVWDRCLLAQTFTPSVSGRLVQLSLGGSFIGVEAEFPTTISIFDTNDGRPGTNLLGRVVIPHLADSTAIRFDNPKLYLVAGTQYAIVLETEAPAYNYQSYSFQCGLYDPYPGGRTWQKIGDGPWLDLDYPSVTSDLIFSTYMVPGIPAVRLTSPSEGTIIKAGETALITAVASELEPPPFTLEVRANGNPVGCSNNSPLRANWNPILSGESELLAVLTNASGLSFTSAVLHVMVVASAPQNDRFADRIRLTNGYCVIDASNFGGNLDPGESPIPSAMGATVWWQWTAPRSGETVVAIAGPQETNALLGVYSGSAVDALLLITNGAGRCSFPATAGATYQIVLDSSTTNSFTNATLIVALNDVDISSPIPNANFYAPASVTVHAFRTNSLRQVTQVSLLANGVNLGDVPLETLSAAYAFPSCGYYSLNLASTDDHDVVTHSKPVAINVRPSNDNIDAAENLTGRTIFIHTSNLAATWQTTSATNVPGFHGDPRWADNEGGHSIWYRWTAPTDGICFIQGRGTNFQVLVNVGLIGASNLFAVVTANALEPANTPVQFDAVAGTTYFISVDGMFGEEGELDWTLHLKPYNDDFASRRLLVGLSSEFIDSTAGASLESGETSLAPLGAGSSLWYNWQAPIPGAVELSVTSSNPLVVVVYKGTSLGALTVVSQDAGGWTNSAVAEFTAESGVIYQIAIFGKGSDEGEFTFQLSLQGLRLVSPLPNSIFPAPATIHIAAQLDVPGKILEQIVFQVNGQPIGTRSNLPFVIDWSAPSAGSYTITASGIATDRSSFESLPVTTLVYADKKIPRPRVYSGMQSDSSYVINAVGALYIFGAYPNQFGRSSTNTLSSPFLGRWPAGVSGWKEISGTWAISDSGALYQDGQILIPFPSGVTAWKHVSRGLNGLVTVGNDGDLYLGGTTRIAVNRPPGGWRDARASLSYVNDVILGLGENNEAYVVSRGPYGDWSVSMLTRPAGVTAWKAIAQAALFGVLLTQDDQLYIYGMYGDVTGTSGNPGFSLVPRPVGVNRWVDFAAGGFHVLAIGDNGQLYAWGRNWEHQLGIAQDQNPRATPVKVDLPSGVTGWSSVAAGQRHSLAIANDCSVYAWGGNDSGQLGQPASAPLARPIRVGSLEALCGTPVIFADGNASRLPDGSFRLEFNTDLNRAYLVQYSDDLSTWKIATPPVIGTGALVEWIDNGPPKTDSHPATVNQRIYRVVYAP